jgi:RNA polymerase sigma-70 factor (ECF subfamily)
MSGSRPEDRSDADLVAAARRGSRADLEALLRRHQPRIYALCRRLAANAPDADDACQQALIGIVRGLDSFDGRSAFSTWAYRVTTNSCLDELRRRRRHPEPTRPEEMTGFKMVGGGGPGSASDEGIDDDVARRLDVDAALATLPTEFRAAVVLRDLCALSYTEIADALDTAPGTVRSRIARGRAALARVLGPAKSGNNPAPSDRQS